MISFVSFERYQEVIFFFIGFNADIIQTLVNTIVVALLLNFG